MKKNIRTPEKAVDAMPKRTMETTSIAGPGKARHLSCHRADSVPLACPIHILQKNHQPTIEGRTGAGGSFFYLFLLITEYWLCQFNEVETVLLQSFDKHLKCLLLAFIFEIILYHVCQVDDYGDGWDDNKVMI